jgi:hypothetical protein
MATEATGSAKIPHIILGACGEYYVAAYLSGMGLTVTVTRGGTSAIDLMVTSGPCGNPHSIQVKSASGCHLGPQNKPGEQYWAWQVGDKAATIACAHYWYAFVSLEDWPQTEGSPSPKVFFVESKFVAERVKSNIGSPEWFWMSEEEAKAHCWLAGYQELKAAIEDHQD